MTQFRPLLAATCDDSNIDKLRYPLLASPKLDGIRALVVEGVLVSRTLKPIRNKMLQERYGDPKWNGMDGEFILGDPTAKNVFRDTTSAVMSADGEASSCRYHIFDNFVLGGSSYIMRYNTLIGAPAHLIPSKSQILKHDWINNKEELIDYEERILSQGFEGVMLRSPGGLYKKGRSTFNEGILLKLKRGQLRNGDAIIIGFTERMHNQNEATIDSLGLQKRTSHKANMSGRGDLGSLLVRDIDTGHEFSIGIGVGLNDALRSEIWINQSDYLGKVVRYEWFAYGNYDVPRFPKLVCFRDKEDISK